MKHTDSFTHMKSLQTEIVATQGIFTAKEIRAQISVNWIGADGEHYTKDFLITESDPEFKEFMHNLGSRKSAEVMMIQDYNRIPG